MSSNLSDNELVEATSSGDQEAFSELYDRYAASLLQFLHARTKASDADAADIAQETWTRVFKGLQEGRFASVDNFRGFLFSAARNVTFDRMRRRAVDRLSDSDVADAIVESEGLSRIVAEEELERLQQLIENLPDNQRDIVRLRFAGLSFDEVSEQLGLPKYSIYQLWHRVLRKLRHQMEEDTVPSSTPRTKREITVLVDPGDAPASLVADLYAALASLYRACGGSGLAISKDERRTFVREVH